MTKPKAKPVAVAEPEAEAPEQSESGLGEAILAGIPGPLLSDDEQAPGDADLADAAFEADPLAFDADPAFDHVEEPDDFPADLGPDEDIVASRDLGDGMTSVVTSLGRKLVMDGDFVIAQTAGPGTSPAHDQPAASPTAD